MSSDEKSAGMKIEIRADLLANILAHLSFQQGFIHGTGQALDKKFDPMDDFLGEIHRDIVRMFDVIGRGEAND